MLSSRMKLKVYEGSESVGTFHATTVKNYCENVCADLFAAHVILKGRSLLSEESIKVFEESESACGFKQNEW